MTAEEYEHYVAELISQLRAFPLATITRNKRFEGVRQPGRYEVDVSVEFLLGNALFFLLIIECKNWERPIDRPTIQKLIQTRDAISAHKAALVSPVGFTKEAIEVAKAHGIALWVIAEKVWHHVVYCKFSSLELRVTYRELRLNCLKHIGYTPQRIRACSLLLNDKAREPATVNLPDSNKTMRIRSGFGALSGKSLESHLNNKMSLDLPEDNHGEQIPHNSDELAALYSGTASYEICSLLLSYASQAICANSESSPLLQWKEEETERLKSYGLTEKDTQTVLDAVLADNQKNCEPILNQLRVPISVIGIRDEKDDSNA